jgi:hypothetical protein
MYEAQGSKMFTWVFSYQGELFSSKQVIPMIPLCSWFAYSH